MMDRDLLNKQVDLDTLKHYFSITMLIGYVIFPFVISLTSKVYDTLWKFYIFIISILAILFFIVLLIKKQDVLSYFKKDLSAVLFLLMAVWMVVSTMVTGWYPESVVGSERTHTGLLCSLCYLVVYGISLFIGSEKQTRVLLLAFFFSHTFICLRIVYRFYFVEGITSIQNLYDVFYNSNHLSYYLLVGLVGIATLFLITNDRVKLILYGVILSIDLAALIISDTLGCLLAFGITLVFFIIVLSLTGRFRLSRYILLILLIVATVFLMRIPSNSDRVDKILDKNTSDIVTDVTSVADIENADGSLGSGRLVLWREAVRSIKESPIFGKGLKQMRENLKEASNGSNDTVHNEFLEYGSNHGIPALVLYIAAIMSVFFRGLKYRKDLTDLNIIGLCIAFGYLVSSFCGVTMFYTCPYLFIFLAIGRFKKA